MKDTRFCCCCVCLFVVVVVVVSGGHFVNKTPLNMDIYQSNLLKNVENDISRRIKLTEVTSSSYSMDIMLA